MRLVSRSTAVLCAIFACAPALANDSSAELGAGGLVLTKNSDIEMRSEDLYVHPDEVRVNYVFFNRADRDISIRVAFPMPDITGSEDPVAIPTEDPVNILGFRTIVNGQPVRAIVEQRVFVGGVEHTALLQSLGVSLAPHLSATGQALDKLPKERRDELERLKLVEVSEYDVGKGMEKHLEPRWTLKTTWHWQQTFAANAETRVQHVYKPATGASAGTSLGSPDSFKEDWFPEYQKKYCMDRDFLSALNRARVAESRRSGPGSSAPYTERRVSYILSTGANWAGPIRDFRLVVDKAEPGNIVSFCGQGVRKISPTQFELRYRDFTPTQDLHVLILAPVKQ